MYGGKRLHQLRQIREAQVAAVKRKPGGGRKPRGEYSGKSAVFSTRITPETRSKLEEAATKSGRSLSQEVERRLEDSFGIQRAGDPYIRALAYLMEQVAIMIPAPGEVRSDPYKFVAFKTAVASLFEKLMPSGEVVVPPLEGVAGEMREVMQTPEGLGAVTAAIVWAQLGSTPELPAALLAEVNAPAGSWLYAFPHARRDLGVEFDPVKFATWAFNTAAEHLKGKKS
jgi:hypothetical protein